MVLLAGEAGIGKTALVRAFASAANVPIHAGSGEPLAVPALLGPLHDIAVTLGEPIVEAADPSAVARALLAALAARGPAVVVVEDCHWADVATLDVLRVAARRFERVPAVLLVTYRDDGERTSRSACLPGTSPRLRAWFGSSRVRSRRTLWALDVAAVIGTNVDPVLLADVSGADPAAVEECTAAGILVAEGRQLQFRHELTRAAVEEAISPPRRALLHGAVARILAAAPIPDHARIAHHAAAAGQDRLVVAHAPAAAAEAGGAGSFARRSRSGSERWWWRRSRGGWVRSWQSARSPGSRTSRACGGGARRAGPVGGR